MMNPSLNPHKYSLKFLLNIAHYTHLKPREAFTSLLTLNVMIFVFISAFIFSVHDGEARPLPPKKSGELRVHFIDIGQGDSALIESPTGKRILVDSGPSRSKKKLDAYLKALKVARVDMLINSHPHADHIGNAAHVLAQYKVKLIMDSGQAHPIRAYRELLSTAERLKIPMKIARKGRTIDIGGGASIQILGPRETLIRGSRSDLNSNSIVFRLSYKDASALFTGDAEEETEESLLREPKSLSASVLKVAHHGSAHASSDRFLEAVNPAYAVVSCSASNRYGHPDPETLHRMNRRGLEPWVTAERGSLVISTSGRRWTLSGEGAIPSSAYGGQLKRKKSPKRRRKTRALKDKTTSSTGLINLNTATISELKTLPRIGPKLAARIIKYRKENGPFSAVDEVTRVKGIGPKTLEKLRPLVKASAP